MPITTKVVSSNPVHDEVYLIPLYVIKFVSDLQQVLFFFWYYGFLHQPSWPLRYNWNVVESGIKRHKPKPKPYVCFVLFIVESTTQYTYNCTASSYYASECEPVGEQYLAIFIIANMLHGVGFTTMFTLGTAYIDDNENNANAALHIGMVYDSFGRFGFLLLEFYTCLTMQNCCSEHF